MDTRHGVSFTRTKLFFLAAAGVMRFEKAHPILDKMVTYMAANFDGQDWGANGPKLVTRVLQDVCSTPNLDQMQPELCFGIKVFPPEAFYPIPWRQWKSYFDSTQKYARFVIPQKHYDVQRISYLCIGTIWPWS